jgi:signal transduction histidine kinase
MPLHVLLCDTAEEVGRLQYQLLRAASDTTVDVVNEPYRAVEAAALTRPHVVVCELTLDGLAGADFVRRLRASSPSSQVIAWTWLRDAAGIAGALDAGAAGYLFKDDGPIEVMRAIRFASEGDVILSPSVASALGAGLLGAVADARSLHEDLERVHDSVSQGTSAKADFLANISHELRTPVTVAKGIAYVLRNPAVSEDERGEFLTQLQGSLDKLMGIVDEIITMAELERGTFELHRTEVDLAPIVQESLEDVRRRYDTVTIEAQIAARLVTLADGQRIGSVVTELLDNACRYSPAGKAVELHARMLEEGVVITVIDRGEGLHRAIATQSFEEPFTTGEGVLRKEKAGVGVGLHLARQLIVEHGGILWTDPLPGGGTRASFCIPRVGAQLQEPPVGAV